MSVTVASLESGLIRARKLGRWLDIAELDGATIDGTNADLADPIRHAMSLSSLDVASTVVVDADLTSLTAGQLGQVLDVAELKTLELILLSLPFGHDPKTLPKDWTRADLIALLERRLASVRKRCDDLYGLDLAPLTAGTIGLSIARPSIEDSPPGDY